MIDLGLHADVRSDLYHLDCAETPSLSKSVAHILCTQSPAHARHAHPRLNPEHVEETKDIFDLGNVAHAVLLEGQSAVHVVDANDWRTNAAKDEREQARAEGKVPLLLKHWQDVVAMTESARKQLNAHQADPQPFTGGKPEVTIVWEDEGVLCRSRIDWLHDGNLFVSDYKTTSRSANPDAWTRSMFSFGADLQAYVHTRAVEAATGVLPELRYVVQETFPPYALSVVGVDAEVLALGMKKWLYARDLWRRCVDRDEWPAYPLEVCYAGLPGYEESRWLEKEVREEMAA